MHSLNEVRKLLSLGEYRVAMDRIEKMEKEGVIPPDLLVLKAICIQLGPGEQKYELGDVENELEIALQIDSECVEALIEAAQYWFYVENDAKKALPLFQKAFEISKSQIAEAVAGVSKCLCEFREKIWQY